MPTYEYACRACGHEFEQFQSIKADPVRTCPACGKRKVERKIGIGGAVIFKGGGFYETDYRSADYEQAKKADAAPSAGAGADAGAGKDGTGKADAGKDATTKAPADAATAAKPSSSGSATGSTTAADAAPKAASTRASGERSGARDDGASGSRKNHAREGRGIGNVLQLGRTKPAARASKPAAKPSRKATKTKGR